MSTPARASSFCTSYKSRVVEDKATQFVHTYGFKDQSSLQQLFQDLLQQGHQITVATHSTFPHVIMEGLKMLGIIAKQMNAIPIICGDFCDVGFGKNLHMSFIKQVIAASQCLEFILIDDTLSNCEAAVAVGF